MGTARIRSGASLRCTTATRPAALSAGSSAARAATGTYAERTRESRRAVGAERLPFRERGNAALHRDRPSRPLGGGAADVERVRRDHRAPLGGPALRGRAQVLSVDGEHSAPPRAEGEVMEELIVIEVEGDTRGRPRTYSMRPADWIRENAE